MNWSLKQVGTVFKGGNGAGLRVPNAAHAHLATEGRATVRAATQEAGPDP